MSGNKYYFFYGHRKPSKNRPIVHGGLFSNRKTRGLPTPEFEAKIKQNRKQTKQIDFFSEPTFNPHLWDPDLTEPRPRITQNPSQTLFSIGRKLSPIARYVYDSMHKHKNWGSAIVSDLNKLHRIPPSIVAEVLKVQTNPRVSAQFFHWAGKQRGYRHNFASYNAFAYCLNRANQYRAADQVPELMRMQGKEPSLKQFEVLIRMHSDAGRGLRVHFVYEKMKKFGCNPTVFLYNRIMDALVKTEHLDLAMAVYDDFKKDGLVEESITFMILIKGLCRVGRLGEVFELLDKMRSNLCKPDVFAYTAMIRTLVSAGNLDGSLRIWEEMIGDSVEPDVMAYTTLITGLCKASDVDRAYGLFREMKLKGCLIDRSVYGSLIESFVSEGNVGFACELLKEMNGSGYRADLSIYNSLIEGLCNEHRVDKAYKLFEITIREGLVPNFLSTKPLLLSFAEAVRIDDICRLLEQIARLGQPVNDELFKFFSFMVSKGERVLKGLEVFEALKPKGYCSISIYTILITALQRIGEAKRALALFEEMKGSGFEPDSFAYSSIIPCLLDVGDLKKACSYYNKIKENSWVPSVFAYTSLVKGLCRDGEIKGALLLVQDCLGHVTSGPMVFKYTLRILHACKSGNAEKVIEVLNEMMQQGCPPEDVIYCAIISGLCKHRNSDEARKVFAIMKKRNLLTEANSIVYEELLIDHMKRTTSGLVLSGLKFWGLESKFKLNL